MISFFFFFFFPLAQPEPRSSLFSFLMLFAVIPIWIYWNDGYSYKDSYTLSSLHWIIFCRCSLTETEENCLWSKMLFKRSQKGRIWPTLNNSGLECATRMQLIWISSMLYYPRKWRHVHLNCYLSLRSAVLLWTCSSINILLAGSSRLESGEQIINFTQALHFLLRRKTCGCKNPFTLRHILGAPG